jgi:hypothetical protein
MATMTTTKKTAERLQNMLIDLLDERARKQKTRSPRWHRSKKGREFEDENRILGELLDAVDNFNTVINQPFEEEE